MDRSADLAARAARDVARAREGHPGQAIDCYLLFASHYDAMDLYGAARGAGIAARISTTPRAARSSCGVALLVGCDDVGELARLAEAGGVELEGVAPLPRQIDPLRDTYC